MEHLSVEDVIGYQIRLILASDLPEDQGTEGQMINPGNLDFAIDFCNDSPEPFKRAAYLLYYVANWPSLRFGQQTNGLPAGGVGTSPDPRAVPDRWPR